MRIESKRHFVVIVGAVVGILFFVWWGSFDSVGDILSDPDSYRTKTVRLFGVTESAYSVPFIGSLYKFSDTSGSMWVISENDSTAQGKRMYLEAVVRISADKEAMKLKGKLQEIVNNEVFDGKQIPPILVERNRGGMMRSLEAIRAGK